ncbi:PXR1 [Candida margitis]|uniref:PXR1 n=1 Tax=Candida margitis TaxID=1775924 RepID=UPI00222789DF|nr:PXR1 [Candida margitis]KAI5957878.1 PXR1 [Candida margitis]
MGLAGTKVKQRFGLDPRNTNWSNDTSRFGHQYLSKMGWAPGSGLGLVKDSLTTHLKIHIKTDNTGLGAKLKKADKDKNLDECSGLDAFQRILGRLNGNEEKVNSVLDKKRNDNILNGKWGMRFVKGEVLSSTWDKDNKMLISYKNKSQEDTKKRDFEEVQEEGDVQKPSEKKMKLEKDDSYVVSRPKKEKKEKKNKDKVSKSEKKEKKDKESKKKEKKGKDKDKESKKEKKEKKEKESKKDKKEKKDGKVKKSKSSKSTKYDSSRGKDSMNSKQSRLEAEVDSSISNLDSSSSRDSTPTPIASRLSGRAKYIRQKRASVMDPKALNEIFMISK